MSKSKPPGSLAVWLVPMSSLPSAHRRPFPLRGVLVGKKYQIGPVIGSGGVGTVYRATHAWTERDVAVKVLDPTLPHFEQLREAFLVEARATVQLQHPNVVDVLDMGEDGPEITYMVMELLHGPTLRDVLLEKGSLSTEETLAILLPLIEALEEAHDLGIVHRDFKPENIILSVDARGTVTPKLLDFGVAQILREHRAPECGTHELVVGTPQYMSPEQARNQRALIGPHTDVWGVGVVWYECVTGRSPFDREGAEEILLAVCEAPIDFEGVPESQVPLLQAALQRLPNDRIATLSDLRARMEAEGVAAVSETEGAAYRSSWLSPEARESYVRETRPGPSGRALPSPGPASEAGEWEPLPLPTKSRRNLITSGIALGLALALVGWWSSARRSESAAAPPTPSPALPVAVAAESPAVPIQELTAADPSPEEAREEAPARSVATEEPEAADTVAPSAQIKPAATRSKSPKARKVRKYERPPDLVTEW